jgi:hypothetical protein
LWGGTSDGEEDLYFHVLKPKCTVLNRRQSGGRQCRKVFGHRCLLKRTADRDDSHELRVSRRTTLAPWHGIPRSHFSNPSHNTISPYSAMGDPLGYDSEDRNQTYLNPTRWAMRSIARDRPNGMYNITILPTRTRKRQCSTLGVVSSIVEAVEEQRALSDGHEICARECFPFLALVPLSLS